MRNTTTTTPEMRTSGARSPPKAVSAGMSHTTTTAAPYGSESECRLTVFRSDQPSRYNRIRFRALLNPDPDLHPWPYSVYFRKYHIKKRTKWCQVRNRKINIGSYLRTKALHTFKVKNFLRKTSVLTIRGLTRERINNREGQTDSTPVDNNYFTGT